MGILKSIFGKKDSSCCDIRIEEVKEELKPQESQKNSCCAN